MADIKVAGGLLDLGRVMLLGDRPALVRTGKDRERHENALGHAPAHIAEPLSGTRAWILDNRGI